MAQKITYWLLIVLILSLGFGQLLRYELFGIPLYLHDILVLLILGLSVTNFVKNYKVRNFVIPDGLKFFLLSILLSSLRAITLYPLSSLFIPALYALRLLSYIALYMFLKIQNIKIPTSIFLISGLVTLFIGLSQYILLPDMRIFANLGWDDHLSRLTLPHFDPTFTAVMLGLFILSFMKIKSIFNIIVLVSSLGGILLTYSRSVWLSLVLTALVFIKNKKLLFLSAVLLLISIFALPQKFGEGTNLFRTYSISSRLSSDIAYIQKYKWDLFIGRGMNTLFLDSASSVYDNHATGPNNSYLYLLTTTGVLGLVGWGTFMYILYKQSRHRSMLLFFFIASTFNNIMFYPFALLWILLTEATYHLKSSV